MANCWRHEQQGFVKEATQTLHGIDGTYKDYFVCDDCANDFVDMYKKETGKDPLIYTFPLTSIS